MGGMPLWLSTMLLGMGTVFVGLICLIFITKLMSACVRAIDRANATKQGAIAEEKASVAVSQPIPDRGTLVAAVSACIASVLGKDVTGLRIVSIKKVG